MKKAAYIIVLVLRILYWMIVLFIPFLMLEGKKGYLSVIEMYIEMTIDEGIVFSTFDHFFDVVFYFLAITLWPLCAMNLFNCFKKLSFQMSQFKRGAD